MYNTFFLCLDGKSHGRFYAPNQKGEATISDLCQFIIQADRYCDFLETPQSATVMRSFRQRGRGEKTQEMDIIQTPSPGNVRGKVATFVIKVMFRNHSSWQGSIYWVEKKHTINFRSVLELIHIIDDAVQARNRRQMKDGV